MSASDTPTGSLYIQEIVQLRATIRAREATILNLAIGLRAFMQLAPTPNQLAQAAAFLRSLEADELLPKGFSEGKS